MDKVNPDSPRCARQGRLALIIILSVLVIDQIIKILVKTNMHLGQVIDITSWFKICFVENNGMAFGMEIIGKLFLSLFRIGAIAFFVWYLIKILNKGFPTGYSIAHFTSIGSGYAPFLYGKVVDMFYFPLWTWPDWMPLVGGDTFFNPVFNFADSCITCGVVALLLCYTKLVNMGLHYDDGSAQDTTVEPDEKD